MANNTLGVTEALLGGLWDAQHQNLRPLVSLWELMLRHCTAFSLVTWVFYLMVLCTYFIGGGFFAIFDLLNLFPQYRIQKKPAPTRAAYWHCIRQILFNYIFIIFPLSFGNHLLLFSWRNIDYTLETFPSLKTMFIQITICFVLEDVLQYIFHRALHISWLYPLIHKVHHHHPAPFGITAAYAHWAEVLILAVPTYSGPLIMAPHLSVVHLWIILRELDSVHTHCGFEFPFQKWINQLVPFYGGAEFHDYHHQAFTVNFASRLSVIDKVFGTYARAHDKGHVSAPASPKGSPKHASKAVGAASPRRRAGRN